MKQFVRDYDITFPIHRLKQELNKKKYQRNIRHQPPSQWNSLQILAHRIAFSQSTVVLPVTFVCSILLSHTKLIPAYIIWHPTDYNRSSLYSAIACYHNTNDHITHTYTRTAVGVLIVCIHRRRRTVVHTSARRRQPLGGQTLGTMVTPVGVTTHARR